MDIGTMFAITSVFMTVVAVARLRLEWVYCWAERAWQLCVGMSPKLRLMLLDWLGPRRHPAFIECRNECLVELPGRKPERGVRYILYLVYRLPSGQRRPACLVYYSDERIRISYREEVWVHLPSASLFRILWEQWFDQLELPTADIPYRIAWYRHLPFISTQYMSASKIYAITRLIQRGCVNLDLAMHQFGALRWRARCSHCRVGRSLHWGVCHSTLHHDDRPSSLPNNISLDLDELEWSAINVAVVTALPKTFILALYEHIIRLYIDPAWWHSPQEDILCDAQGASIRFV